MLKKQTPPCWYDVMGKKLNIKYLKTFAQHYMCVYACVCLSVFMFVCTIQNSDFLHPSRYLSSLLKKTNTVLQLSSE